MSETEISYQTTIEIERTDAFGRLAGWIGEHPLWGGLIGGLGAVAIAAAYRFEQVRSAPVDALILSSVVVVVWVVLFYFMREFFARQRFSRERVRRALQIDENRLVWREGNEALRRLESPTYRLYTQEVPEEMREGRGAGNPWPVWLVAEGDGGARLVVETKITAGEAAHYEAVDEAVAAATDEELPTTVVSPLLNRAERAVG